MQGYFECKPDTLTTRQTSEILKNMNNICSSALFSPVSLKHWKFSLIAGSFSRKPFVTTYGTGGKHVPLIEGTPLARASYGRPLFLVSPKHFLQCYYFLCIQPRLNPIFNPEKAQEFGSLGSSYAIKITKLKLQESIIHNQVYYTASIDRIKLANLQHHQKA